MFLLFLCCQDLTCPPPTYGFGSWQYYDMGLVVGISVENLPSKVEGCPASYEPSPQWYSHVTVEVLML